ncbi:transketolase [Paenibacillus cisolokensis]|uniref:transketolase n=1 Tax=Paenibacillus cisolokensis TaxID=1658519 RepID=UPI003D2DEFF4
MMYSDQDLCAVQAIRMLSVDAIEKAGSGHPGLPMGAAPMAYVLWSRFLKFQPANPHWWNRDRFVLSAGHGSMLLYSLLHLFQYDVSLEDLKQFRQWGSNTPGHPEYGHTPGVECTTGPLGQGFAMAVGMAMAERFLAARYNRDGYNMMDHYTYCLCGDGDLMEGVAAEAASLAGHLRLSKLVVLYDSNDISLDGETKLAFTERVAERFEAYGWQVLKVEDGNDLTAIHAAIEKAQQSQKPALIEVKTIIGYGSPNKAGTSESHGSPLGEAEISLVREAYRWPHPPFEIPEHILEPFRQAVQRGIEAEQSWKQVWNGYREAFPDLASELEKAFAGELPEGWESALPVFHIGEKVATRDASGKAINALASAIPYFLGGSADLASSNKTTIRQEEAYQPENFQGRNIWFGVREHAMAAALNGMSLHGGLRVYGGTFFVFSDYMKPAMRLSALMGQPVIYVLTHDSIAVGEDGPTHQPIEQLAGLRSIPNLLVLRPSDANETMAAYQIALSQSRRPSALVLTRQALPVTAGSEKGRELAHRGAYIRVQTPHGHPDLLLIASGSEVPLAIEVASMLEQHGRKVNVVSMLSWELFEEQDQAYRNSVIPPHIRKRVCIEMGSSLGWERYAGSEGLLITLDRFGASAPGSVLLEKYGFTKEQIFNRITEWYGN